jgi:hypothetical protein
MNLSLKTKLDFMWSALNNTNISVVAKVNILNSSLHNLNLSMKQDFVLLNATLNSLNASIKTQINMIMNNINTSKLNITTKITIIKDLILMSLQEQNSTFSYQLKFGTPSVNGMTYQFPVFVSLFNGQIANLSVTQQAWQSLKLFYVSGNRTIPLNFSVLDEKAGSFVISIYNISSGMAQNISSNDAIITGQGMVKEGVLTNLAAGIIGSQQIQYSSSNIWTEIFGIPPPHPNDSISGAFQYLSWLARSYAGRAIYLVVILVALLYYIIMIEVGLDRWKNKK